MAFSLSNAIYKGTLTDASISYASSPTVMRPELINNDILFTRSSGVVLVDLSTPSTPTIRSVIQSGAEIVDIGLINSTTIIILGRGSVWTYDISNPDSPTLLDTLAINDGFASGITSGGMSVFENGTRVALSSSWTALIYLIDSSNPSNLVTLDTYSDSSLQGTLVFQNDATHGTWCVTRDDGGTDHFQFQMITDNGGTLNDIGGEIDTYTPSAISQSSTGVEAPDRLGFYLWSRGTNFIVGDARNPNAGSGRIYRNFGASTTGTGVYCWQDNDKAVVRSTTSQFKLYDIHTGANDFTFNTITTVSPSQGTSYLTIKDKYMVYHSKDKLWVWTTDEFIMQESDATVTKVNPWEYRRSGV